MSEEIKEGQTQSWWQTLPGILTAIAGILTAVTGLILALSQTGPLWKTEPSGTATFSGSPAVSKGSLFSVSFPLSEVRIVDAIGTTDRDLGYKIVAASLSRSTQLRSMLTISFVIRVTNDSKSYVFANARFFRLVADGDVIAPEGSTLAGLSEGQSQTVTADFAFPETTKSATLQVGEIDQKTIRLPLSLKIAQK